MKMLSFFCAASLLGLTACSDGAPNDKTFTKALNAYHAQNPQCIVAAVDITEEGKAGPLRIARAERPSSMDRLSKAGLMTRTERIVGTPPKNQAFYEVTPLGRASLEPSSFGGDVMKACFGTRTVKDIISFTEPVEKDGTTSTSVTYSFTMKNAPEWANAAVMQEGFRQLEFDMMPGGNQRSEDLVKTNKGWVVQ